MPSSNFASLAGLGTVLLFLAAVARTIYNLFFHPLASFPGPLLHRATRWAFLYKLYQGTLVFDVLALHEKYGPVIRIAPDELAFADAQAWKDIYGHRTGAAQGTDEMPKWHRFFNIPGIEPSIIAETRDNHTVLRRQMAHGFSDKSMRGQEPIIGSYVNLLIQRLRERAIDPDRRHPVTGELYRRRLDMTMWYNWTTFDIISDLAFGEPLGCLDRGVQHPWLGAVQGALKTNIIGLTISHMGMSAIMPLLLKYGLKRRKEHIDRTEQKLQRRVEMTTERPDFIEGLLRKKDEWNMPMKRLQANASALIVGGSETTATLLCGVTYLLLTNPEALKKVAEEVRSTFKSDEEITLTSVGGLTYMLACLNEGLRSYPPVPFGLPRMVPRGGATISGMTVPENTGVAVWQWATYHRSNSWTEPFKFRPERFLGDPEFATDKVDTLQPFSVGPRNCIGRNLAYAEMRLILAKVLFNFDMELADKGVDWITQKAYLLWDKPPLEVYLTPRD